MGDMPTESGSARESTTRRMWAGSKGSRLPGWSSCTSTASITARLSAPSA
jgi:hypothetical protein